MIDALAIIVAAWGALAIASISPGPNMVAVASHGLGAGRIAALAVTLGISFGAFGWAILTASGAGLLFSLYPNLYTLMGIAGGSYLAWLGVKGWRAALTSRPGEIVPSEGRGLYADIIHGLVVTGTNPKVALVWVSLSTFVSEAISSPLHLLLFAGGSSMVVFVIYGSYGLLFSDGNIRKVYQRFQRASEAVFGSIFLALGLAMIIRAMKGG